MTLSAARIASVFDDCFGSSHRTRCIGGEAEPLYLPGVGDECAQLRYRGDYAASALHEISHWCLAGAKRRTQTDFGYAYAAAPRSLVDQVQFLRAEVRPQALERVFAKGAGIAFQYSFDDVEDRYVQLRPGFRAAVDATHQRLLRELGSGAGLPRAQRFCAALARAA